MEPFEIATTLERALINRASSAGVPVTGSIELLPLCNMNCEMCYVRLSPEELHRQGRMRTAEEWIAAGRQMAERGVLFLLLTGGEPLLFPEFRRLFVALQELGLILTINTNGTLLDEDWADFFAQHRPRRINITLYGADEAAYGALCHYPEGFGRAVRAVRLLRERGLDVKLSTSLTRANAADLEALHQIGEELGVPFRTDTYMLPAVRERSRPFAQQSRLLPEEAARARMYALHREMDPETFSQYTAQLRAEMAVLETAARAGAVPVPRGMDCLAGSCSFSVSWKGELHPCVILDKPAADLFSMGFSAAWEQVHSALQTIRLNSACALCRLRPLCRTCAACALLEAGSYDGLPFYMCRYAEASLQALADYTDDAKDG